MKVVLTGASGTVGRQLVPRLSAAGVKLLLVGRSVERLRSLFPSEECISYESLTKRGKGFDWLVHLAVQNNNTILSDRVFEEVNVDFYESVLKMARDASIGGVINVSSFHALADGPDTPYARSKRKALQMSGTNFQLPVINLLLPPVHGEVFSGRLSLLHKLPQPLRRIAFAFLSSLTPVVHVNRICDFIIFKARNDETKSLILLADPKSENKIFIALKRSIDIIFASAILLIFWWLLVIVWIAVKTTSKGPGIFAQTRIGKNEVPFTCYKFRTMAVDTHHVGTHEVNAASITKIGALLRKTKIDELPQIWNIFAGQISLVGPRPCLPSQKELIVARSAYRIFDILPGITGLSQVRDIDMSIPYRLSISDAEYIACQSLLLDIKIIVWTFLGRGQGDKVRP